MEYRTEVSPVCLPDADVAAGTECVATGWGDTKGENTRIFPFPIVFLSIFTGSTMIMTISLIRK